MITLIAAEQSKLLREWGTPEDPYYGPVSPSYYIQFYPPQQFRALQSFVSAYFEIIGSEQPCLVVFTDWALYEQHEMELIVAARLASGDARPLIESSGHFLNANEKNMGTAYFSLATAYGWSSYLYLPGSKTTLFNWEGDIFDFWTDSEKTLEEMRNLVTTYELKYTQSEQSGADNPRPCGTSGMAPADSASRAGALPEASGGI